MSYVVVLPWIWRPFRDDCLAGCKLENVLEVDNTVNNLGIMRAHNLGIDAMYERDADWLIIMSAAVRFGPNGGLDLIEALRTTHAEADVVNVVNLWGWHCLAFSRRILDLIGRWDENYSPYGYDDNDLAVRIRKADPAAVWMGVTGCEIGDTIMGHSIKLAGVHSPAPPRLAYFVEKWGLPPGHQFDEFHDHPWNDVTNPIGFWPPVADGGRWDGPAPAGQEQCRWR